MLCRGNLLKLGGFHENMINTFFLLKNSGKCTTLRLVYARHSQVGVAEGSPSAWAGVSSRQQPCHSLMVPNNGAKCHFQFVIELEFIFSFSRNIFFLVPHLLPKKRARKRPRLLYVSRKEIGDSISSETEKLAWLIC